MARPLIHIGYPKTASTWLQRSLFKPEFGFAPALNHVEVQYAIVAPTPFQYFPQLIKDRFHKNLGAVNDLVPVISSEVLSGNIYCGGYNAKQNADRLYETFPDAKVLIVAREQKSLIRALFKTLVQWGMPHSIQRLLSPLDSHRFPQFNLDYLRFNLIAGYYRNLYGEENVLVIPYELFAHSPMLFLEEIMAFSGSSASMESLTAKPGAIRSINSNKPISAIMFQRWFNYFFLSNALNYSGLFASPFNEGAYRIRQHLEFLRLPGFIDDIMERKFRKYIEQKTAGEFLESNRELQSMCKHELGELGYEI